MKFDDKGYIANYDELQDMYARTAEEMEIEDNDDEAKAY
jgi:hypothetical protein